MSKTLFDLSGEVAVVIGGTGALGGAMADALAAHGATVAIVGRNQERGAQSVDRIQSAGGKALFVTADALDAGSLADACDAITEQAGAASVLVSAAGGNRPDATLPPGSDFCDLPEEAWRGVFDLNLVGGSLLPAQVFGRAMVKVGRGSIINIASMSGMIPLSARRRLLGRQGGCHQSHAVLGARVGDQRRPRQRDQPRLLPSRSKPRVVIQRRWHLPRAWRPNHRPHAHRAVRQTRRVGRRRGVAGFGSCVVVCDGAEHRGRWRFFVDHHLTPDRAPSDGLA